MWKGVYFWGQSIGRPEGRTDHRLYATLSFLYSAGVLYFIVCWKKPDTYVVCAMFALSVL